MVLSVFKKIISSSGRTIIKFNSQPMADSSISKPCTHSYWTDGQFLHSPDWAICLFILFLKPGKRGAFLWHILSSPQRTRYNASWTGAFVHLRSFYPHPWILQIRDSDSTLIVAQLLFLEAEDSTKPIHLYINSPGGSVTAGLAIYDTVRKSCTNFTWSYYFMNFIDAGEIFFPDLNFFITDGLAK